MHKPVISWQIRNTRISPEGAPLLAGGVALTCGTQESPNALAAICKSSFIAIIFLVLK